LFYSLGREICLQSAVVALFVFRRGAMFTCFALAVFLLTAFIVYIVYPLKGED
jgi:hypothetical protein